VALAAAYRALTRANMLAALKGTMAISGMILFIIVGATTFSQILSFSGASTGLVSSITGQGLSPMAIIRRDDAGADRARRLRRPGQHDADHPADLHAGGASSSASTRCGSASCS
jgi:uncharacterized membrane protein YuzA (DUF378 family)